MQRLYNTRRWPNPVVLKITAARLGVVPPAVETDEAVEGGSPTTWRLQGRLTDVGEGDAPEVSFQYRPQRLLTDPLQPWQETERQILASPGEFSVTAEVDPGVSYEFQALAHRGAVTVAGDKKYFQSGQPTNVTEV